MIAQILIKDPLQIYVYNAAQPRQDVCQPLSIPFFRFHVVLIPFFLSRWIFCGFEVVGIELTYVSCVVKAELQ